MAADDLTGASDAGVQFAKAGLRTTVWLDDGASFYEDGAQVAVVDMDSRASSPQAAHERMTALLARLGPRSAREVIKKIDSTLRGNLGPEVRALLEALPGAFAIVAPAYPKNGRTCRDGAVYVHGIRVDATDFARDLVSPVRDAAVSAHLESPSGLLPLARVREGAIALNAKIEQLRADEIRVAVADAETDDDLRAIAALQSLRDDVLWAGSAGLLEMLRLADATDVHDVPTAPTVQGPVVLVVGSISATTQDQVEAFASRRDAHTELIDPVELLARGHVVGRAIARAAAAVDRGIDSLIAVVGERDHVARALAYGDARGWGAAETSRRLRNALVETADRIVAPESGRTVVLSGGDVARAFCERRGIRGMTVLAEAAPGIPISRAIGANLLLVTKAGGFGDRETYATIVAKLHAKVTA